MYLQSYSFITYSKVEIGILTDLTGLMEEGVRMRLMLCTKSMMKSPNEIPMSTRRTWTCYQYLHFKSTNENVHHTDCMWILKGQCHEIFVFKFFSWISFPQAPALSYTCTVVSVNGTPVEAKLCTFTFESTHFVFNLCPIYTHDGASAKFSTNSQETAYSVTIPVGPFRIFPKIWEDIRSSRHHRGVVDTGGKWAKSSVRKVLNFFVWTPKGIGVNI